MSGFGLVAGVAVLFFACGILTGVLAVLALSALRGHRQHGGRRRYAQDEAGTLDWNWPRRPSGPDWEDRPGWDERRGSDEIEESPPPWPGGRRD